MGEKDLSPSTKDFNSPTQFQNDSSDSGRDINPPCMGLYEILRL